MCAWQDKSPLPIHPAIGILAVSRNFNLVLHPAACLKSHEKISSKPKGPGEQGAAEYCPKILLLQRSVPSIGVIWKSALDIGQFLRRNFWMISGGPFLSRPFCFTAEERGVLGWCLRELQGVEALWAVSGQVARGQMFMCYPQNPRTMNIFARWLGGSVNWVFGQSFTC